jgi:hypothetical protein
MPDKSTQPRLDVTKVSPDLFKATKTHSGWLVADSKSLAWLKPKTSW